MKPLVCPIYLYSPLRLVLTLLLLISTTIANPIPKVWSVPAENPNFIAREDVISQIFAIFNDLRKKTDTKTVVLQGHQGFGKTQIAKRYVYKYFSGYDVVWWFKANQYIKPQFEQFAFNLGSQLGWDIEHKIQRISEDRLIFFVSNFIRTHNLKVLIIFDDAKTYAEIEKYVLFSHEGYVHTIITSKNSNFSSTAIQIKPFTRENSIAYIDHFLPHELQRKKEHLASSLGDCPAALAFAIEYIKSYPGMDISQYISKHAAKKRSMLPSLSKLGSALDEYDQDLFATVNINLDELHQNSEEAFQLLGFLAILHHDEIPVTYAEKWMINRGVKSDFINLIDLINQYSFIDFTPPKHKRKDYISMHELIQTMVSKLVPVVEKERLIDEATKILGEIFADRTDKVAAIILKDNAPLLHAIKLSQEADTIDYHSTSLTSLRVNANSILIGALRDYETAKTLLNHLQKDFASDIRLSKKDEIKFNIDLFLLCGSYPDYKQALTHSDKALYLLASEDGMVEEKIQIYANLIQYYALVGLSDECEQLVQQGETLLPLSKSPTYNALYVSAVTMFMLNRGEVEQTIKLITLHNDLLESHDIHPSMQFFLLLQLAKAFVKQGNHADARNTLTSLEDRLREFYATEESTYFVVLNLLKAACYISSNYSLPVAETLIHKALVTQERLYRGKDKHRNQAFAHLLLGNIYHLNQHHDLAKHHYLESESIYEKLLKNKQIDDVSELYKSLALLGVDLKDETLTHTYLKKHLDLFGLGHARTKEVILYIDERGLPIPF